MTIYYACDGTISTVGNGSNQGFKCSTGFYTYTPPTAQTAQTVQFSGELLTAADTSQLLAAVMLLVALWATFKIILNAMGIKL
jgi:hypothetical protein